MSDQSRIEGVEFLTTFLMGILIGVLCGMALGCYLYYKCFLI